MNYKIMSLIAVTSVCMYLYPMDTAQAELAGVEIGKACIAAVPKMETDKANAARELAGQALKDFFANATDDQYTALAKSMSIPALRAYGASLRDTLNNFNIDAACDEQLKTADTLDKIEIKRKHSSYKNLLEMATSLACVVHSDEIKGIISKSAVKAFAIHEEYLAALSSAKTK